jgi:cellulose synthase operon protein C
MGRRQEAAQILGEIPAAGATGGAIQDRIGRLWLDSAHFEEARTCFVAATEAAPRNPAYWANLGAAELGLGHLEAANQAVSQGLRVDPESVAAKRMLVNLRLRENLIDEALSTVQTSTIEQPFNPAAWELAGDTYSAVKDYRKALYNYESASRIAPSGTLALKSYQALRSDGAAETLDPLLKWLKRHPGDSLARRALAQAYESGGERGEAIKHYEVLVGKGYEDAGVFNNLALLYLRQGDARALATAHRAHELAPAAAAVADTYGWTLVETGRLSEGLKVLQTAAAAPEASGDTRFHYAAALSRSGARERARDLLTTLLASNARLSDRTEAQHLLQQL